MNKKNKNLRSKRFYVLNMTCAACANAIKSAFYKVEAVEEVSIGVASKILSVKFDDKKINAKEIKTLVKKIGYDLVEEEEGSSSTQEAKKKNYKKLKKQAIGSLIFSFPVFMIGMFFMHSKIGEWISMILSAVVLFYFGKNFFVNAYRKVLIKKSNMDTLVALSTGCAFLFSVFNTFYSFFKVTSVPVYYESATVIISFILIGKLLEEKAKHSSFTSLRKLIGLQPKTAKILGKNQEIKETPIYQIKKEDIVIIHPGEIIPVDGEILKGHSFVDESNITGEALSIEKIKGDKLISGTLNQQGSFQMIAKKVGEETFLSQMIKKVQKALESKIPIEKLVDKISSFFVPSVLVISLLTFFLWFAIGGLDSFYQAINAALAVLIISCPCALGLATPMAIVVGIEKGAKNQILIKDAEALEVACKINCVVLDKTGTITKGSPIVNEEIWEANQESNFHKNALFSLENLSKHPLAQAIITKMKEKEAEIMPIKKFESLSAKGLKGTLENREIYFVGNEKLIKENKISISEALKKKAKELENKANTIVYFASLTHVLAVFGLSDEIKSTSKKAIKILQRKGIEVYMLTGDNEKTAQEVSKKVGIKHFKAHMLPEEKAKFIKQLQQEKKVVAMVGDGINDAQAMAQSDVSMAMGKGSDIAMDVAKITLIHSDLNSIATAIKLSKKVILVIKQNLFWAFIYNLIGIPIAAGILYPLNGFLLTPMLAGLFMVLSSLSVVANSLRLKF